MSKGFEGFSYDVERALNEVVDKKGLQLTPEARRLTAALAPEIAAAFDTLVDDLVECEKGYAADMDGEASPDTRPDARVAALRSLLGDRR